MFWKKTGEAKLPGPRPVPEIVARYLAEQKKIEPGLVTGLRAVVKPKGDDSKRFDIRLFDEAEAKLKNLPVKDYLTLDQSPTMVIFEGWYDESSRQVELEQKKKWGEPTKLFTLEEIQQKIEGLSEPGSSVCFYQARGGNIGGPLGRGAVIVELNPEQKGKKYIVSTADVDGTEPAGKRTKVMASDKAKEIAAWVKEAHHQPGLVKVY